MTATARSRVRSDSGYYSSVIAEYRNLPFYDWGVKEQVWPSGLLGTSSETIDDFVVKDYRARIAAGEVINNPCTYTSTTLKSAGSYSFLIRRDKKDYRNKGSSGSLTWTMLDKQFAKGLLTQSIPVLDGATLEKICKHKALSYIDDTPYGFMEDVFEIRETLRFLKNPVKSLADLSRSFRKDIRKGKVEYGLVGKKQADALADLWLTYRFAASPLLRSINDATEVLSGSLADHPVLERRTARGISSLADGGSFPINRSSNSWSCSYDRSSVRTLQGSAGILYQVDNPAANIPSLLGFRAQDLPETLWAIVPYSFMVDRVLDISGAIRGITNLSNPNVKVLAAWYRLKDLDYSTIRLRTILPYYNGDFTTHCVGDEVQRTNFSYTRTLWDPTWTDALPPVDIKGLVSDATKIADLLALVHKNFKVSLSTRR